MTRVNFYIIDDASSRAREHLACRLTEKAFSLGNKIFIHTASDQQSTHVDKLLWTYRAGSFLPHKIHAGTNNEPCAILIGHDVEPEANTDVLINLAQEVPLFFSRFDRVAELVNADQAVKAQARKRYKFYNERGYELETHKLNA